MCDSTGDWLLTVLQYRDSSVLCEIVEVPGNLECPGCCTMTCDVARAMVDNAADVQLHLADPQKRPYTDRAIQCP